MATLSVSATPESFAASDVCPSCGTALAGDYCHACGERRHADERFSIRHFFGEVWEEIFDLDSRALRSVRLLVAKPGFLTLEALRGRRRPYLGALRMYLIVFAAALFVTSLIPDRAGSKGTGADRLTALFNGFVHTLAVRRGETDAAARKALEQTTAQHVGWVSVLIPLMFAGFLFLLFHRRRRWFGEHLLFATHFATMNFLVALVIVPFQLAAIHFLSANAATVGVQLSAVVVIPLFAWMVLAVRRVYEAGWGWATGSSLILFVGFSICQGITGVLALCTAGVALMYF